jgi:3-deoxy-D-manno-octulosonate 8-phosphate phosphatase (KDO 8-P phosphatase)
MPDAKHIRALILDVDGVLTDGSIFLDDRGVETKRFNVRDGQGIATWIRLGFEVAIITKRASRGDNDVGAVMHRARELGIRHVIQGARDKSAALDEVIRLTGIPPEHMAYMGDDWPDIAPMKRVALAITVPDAAAEVHAIAHWTTTRRGGDGAVREAIERLLREKNISPLS